MGHNKRRQSIFLVVDPAKPLRPTRAISGRVYRNIMNDISRKTIKRHAKQKGRKIHSSLHLWIKQSGIELPQVRALNSDFVTVYLILTVYFLAPCVIRLSSDRFTPLKNVRTFLNVFFWRKSFQLLSDIVATSQANSRNFH